MASQRLTRLIWPAAALAGAALLFYCLDYLIAQPIPKVDASAEYPGVIGKRFRTQQDLIAIGYTVDRNYKKQVDYVTLVLPPGFSGPEVVTRENLPKGTLLEVSGALKTDSWLVSRLEYVVRPVDRPKPSDAPMTVDIDLKSERNFGLDESVYVSAE